jgi:hypothetical protein
MICQDGMFHVSTITPIDFHILFFNCLSAHNASILDDLSVMKLQKFINNTDCLFGFDSMCYGFMLCVPLFHLSVCM